MKTKNLTLSCLIVFTSLLAPTAFAEHTLGLGVKILGSTWKGENKDSNTEFESTHGSQLGFNLVYQYKRLYTGFNFQGGEYKFKDDAPDKIYKIGKERSRDLKINRAEADILVGYYFWQKVSLFLDLKSIANEWKDDDSATANYATQFLGVGFGVSGYIPLNDDWMLFGSFGVVPNGTIRQVKGDEKDDKGEIGNGDSGALEFGAIYQFNRNNRLNFGLKSQWQNYEFDNIARSEQKHQLTSLFIGYNYLFLFGQH